MPKHCSTQPPIPSTWRMRPFFLHNKYLSKSEFEPRSFEPHISLTDFTDALNSSATQPKASSKDLTGWRSKANLFSRIHEALQALVGQGLECFAETDRSVLTRKVSERIRNPTGKIFFGAKRDEEEGFQDWDTNKNCRSLVLMEVSWNDQLCERERERVEPLLTFL